ncbi:MAG: hypothetical protein KDK71_00230 [Chlamydiia bacterium]|nr:hypothetical protein [Chlamydiia bacterium]
MKRFVLSVLLVFQFPLGLLAEEGCEEYEKLVYEIVDSFAETVKEEFDLELIKWGGVFRDYLRKGVGFHAFRRATLDEARALELAVIERLTATIQAHQEIQPYLKEYDIDPKKIFVDISFVQSKEFKSEYDDGTVCHVCKFRYPYERLVFKSKDPFGDKYGTDSTQEIEEPLEEARAINCRSLIDHLAIHKAQEYEDELYRLFALFEKEMKRKHSIELKAIGWIVPGKEDFDVGEIRGRLKVSRRTSHVQARLLMVAASQRLLDLMNQSEILKPHLKESPFPASRLKLQLIVRKNEFFVGEGHYRDGTIDSVILDENRLIYKCYSPDPERKDRTHLVVCGNESFEEAQMLGAEKTASTFLGHISNICRDMFDKIIYFFQGIVTFFFFLILPFFL